MNCRFQMKSVNNHMNFHISSLLIPKHTKSCITNISQIYMPNCIYLNVMMINSDKGETPAAVIQGRLELGNLLTKWTTEANQVWQAT